jgi:hypothetical protein
MSPSKIRYPRSRTCPFPTQVSIATKFPFQVRELAGVRFAGHAAPKWIEIKPPLSPDSTIESRSADLAVRTQHVHSRV